MSYITLIQAPQIPGSERTALEEHFLETVLDPTSVLAVNYEIRIDIIEKEPNAKIIVTAPGIPHGELLELRRRIAAAFLAEKPQEKFIVVNYECLIFTMPEEPEAGKIGSSIVDPDPEQTKAGHEEGILIMRAAQVIRMNQEEKDAKKADGQTDEKA
jgi:hypothetical protein